MGNDEIQPMVLKEMADTADRLLSISRKAKASGKVSGDWKKGSSAHNFKRNKQKDPRNYQQDSFTSVPGKVME